MKDYNVLNEEEQRVILHKWTESPGSWEFNEHKQPWTYICRQCDAPLYKSEDKFSAGCGWPSFDDEIEGAVKRNQDADGRRVEIVCQNCDGHLWHVFVWERLTEKNTRHCVNSISLKFIPETNQDSTIQKAYVAGGCFWGMEELFRKEVWVVDTKVWYTGGQNDNPTYRNHPWHAEALEISYDSNLTSFKNILDFFFRIHNPTTVDRQGNDRWSSYRSAIFYQNTNQRDEAEKFISIVNSSGRWPDPVVTTLEEYKKFYLAEDYHQDYLQENINGYTCHYVRFPSYIS